MASWRGGLDVRPGQHAVAADVGIDDGRHAVALEAAGELLDAVIGDHGPAVDGHQPVFGVEPDNDVVRKGAAGAGDEGGLLHGLGADDAPAQPASR
jgi:hypothetical protein